MTIDANKLPAEVLERMAKANHAAHYGAPGTAQWHERPQVARDRDIAAMQAAYDASPGPALEAENARLREALAFYRDNWTFYAVGDEGDGVTDLGRLDGYEAEPNAALKADAGERARTAIARAKGE